MLNSSNSVWQEMEKENEAFIQNKCLKLEPENDSQLQSFVFSKKRENTSEAIEHLRHLKKTLGPSDRPDAELQKQDHIDENHTAEKQCQDPKEGDVDENKNLETHKVIDSVVESDFNM